MKTKKTEQKRKVHDQHLMKGIKYKTNKDDSKSKFDIELLAKNIKAIVL